MADDVRAFSAWVTITLPSLLRFGHQLTGDPYRGEELAQAALVKTWAAWARVQDKDDPGAYVRRVMVTTHLTWWRRLRRELLSAAPPERAGVDAHAAFDERDALIAALSLLGTRQRTVIVLRYFEDLSEQQVADLMGCSVGTVKSQASRAMATLREVMSEHERAPLRREAPQS